MFANEIIHVDPPKKMVAMGHAFRAEGLAGSTNKGLYRVHQFTKVEMFSLCSLDQGMQVFDSFIGIQKSILNGLELCFRVLNMPSEELGAPAHIKYDMEVWMPGRGEWGEVSSTSYCTDYQSRRLGIRHPNKDISLGPYSFVGTGLIFNVVNGTAAAIPRLIISLLETHQQSNGDIYIPKALRKYLYGDHVEFIPRPSS